MSTEEAEQFARHWISSWNNHDLSAIMGHYGESVLFTSPFIVRLGVSEKGVIDNKSRLREYFEIALKKYPELKFEFIKCLKGVNSVVLYYISVNNLFAAEWMEFDSEGKVIRVTAHYSE